MDRELTPRQNAKTKREARIILAGMADAIIHKVAHTTPWNTPEGVSAEAFRFSSKYAPDLYK